MDLTGEGKIGLIVGCTLGGSILFILFTFLFCLICRPRSDKKKHPPQYDPTYYNSKASSRPSNPELPPPQMVVPPGVWTSNPTMFAGAPSPAYIYANGGDPQRPPQPQHNQHNYHNQHPQENGYVSKESYQSEPNLNHSNVHGMSWYHRTLRRAKSMLKQLPAVFQVQGPGGFMYRVYAEEQLDFDFATSTGLVYLKPADRPKGKYSADGRGFSRSALDMRSQGEVSETLQVADMTITEKSHRIQPQSLQELEDSFERRSPSSGPGSGGTARVYSTLPPRIPEDAAVDHASGPHVAKVYSNYRLAQERNKAEGGEDGTDAVDEDGLPSTSNTKYYTQYNGGGSDIGVTQDDAFITQSDWVLNKKSQGLGRSQSNVEKNKVGSFLSRSRSTEKNNSAPGKGPVRSGSSAAVGPGGRYQPGVYLKSTTSDAQLFSHKRQTSGNNVSKRKHTADPGADVVRPGIARPAEVHKASAATFVAPAADIRAAEEMEERLRPKRVAPPPPPSPPAVTTSLPHVVMREKTSSSAPTRTTSVTRHSSHPDDPNALYAVPSRVRESKLSRASSATQEEVVIPVSPAPPPPPPPPPVPGSPNQMTVEAVVEPQRSIRRPRTKSVASTTDFNIRDKPSEEVQVTQDAFQFLDNFSVQDTVSMASVDTMTTGEQVASDAFKFLDEFEDNMSFGDEIEDIDDDPVVDQNELFNY